MTRLSIGKEDRIQNRKGGNLLAAHGIDLQGGKEVVTHRQLHLRTRAHGREVEHVTDRVGGGPHTERVRNVGLATCRIRNADSHVITATFREEIVHGIDAKGVNHLPTHIPSERANGITLVITIVVVRKLAMRHQMDGVVRTDIEIQIAVVLQMRVLAARRRIKRHIDALARTHTVGGEGETGTFVLTVGLETDSQTT